jgi:DNA-binding NarL/FixJ family response regulator
MDKIKICIVDDEAGILEEVKDFFLDEGFDVSTADCGADGIDLVKSVQPAILILDIKLPDMSGLEVLRATKQNSPHTKVIVMTGYVDQNIIDEAEKLGRDIFMRKDNSMDFKSSA